MSEILGHQRVKSRLWSALSRGSLHHALLFEGPSGVGKRTVATRLAMAANCAGPADQRPCGACPACRQIASGQYPDVIVLEPDTEKATATITVDQIREVTRQTGYHRYAGRQRFIVIDPAEAMLPAAANALLKTLEEPPAGTGFILIANHASALLPTIVSRCQRHRFGAIPEAELVPWLAQRGHADAERLARVALGCPGKALELANGRLDARQGLRQGLFDALAADFVGTYAFSERVCEGGSRQEWRANVEQLFEVIEDLLRDIVATGSRSQARRINDDAPEVLDRWTHALWPTGVTRCATALSEAREALQANASGRLVVDAVLARMRAELGNARRAG